jgi:hypothetical protein
MGESPHATSTPKRSMTRSPPQAASRCSSTRRRASSRAAPELDKALLSANRSGDQLVITKLDRLGRSLEHLIELSKLLQTRGVDLVVVDQGTTPPPRWAGCSSRSSARSQNSSTR